MKNFFAALFFLFSQVGFAQNETKVVDQNRTKIDQLNERLDRLLNGDSSGEVDSTNYKLDYIFQEIRNIKSELNAIKTSVDELKTIERSTERAEVAANGLAVNSTISDADYFVVLASGRTLKEAELKLRRIKDSKNSMIIENDRGSWFHIVLKQPLDIKEAGKVAKQYRHKGFTDAWWTTGKKLKR